MEIKVKRITRDKNYTIGNLFINGTYFCDTIEDCDRGLSNTMTEAEIKSKKIYGQTAIPTGTYKVTLDVVSPKFKDRSWAKFCDGKLPRLIDVKGYEGVLIHVGNRADDTLGCILVGNNASNGTITNSTSTFKNLYSRLEENKNKGEDITIKIE